MTTERPLRILTLSGSPSRTSRTARLLSWVGERLVEAGASVSTVVVRDLPADALLGARADEPAIADAVRLVAEADGVVIATPVYKAAYAGVLKVFLDLLPPAAFAGKVVLPIATGGSPAHALVIDYALAPVLAALGAGAIVPGAYVIDKQIAGEPGGPVALDDAARADLLPKLAAFRERLG